MDCDVELYVSGRKPFPSQIAFDQVFITTVETIGELANGIEIS